MNEIKELRECLNSPNFSLEEKASFRLQLARAISKAKEWEKVRKPLKKNKKLLTPAIWVEIKTRDEINNRFWTRWGECYLDQNGEVLDEL